MASHTTHIHKGCRWRPIVVALRELRMQTLTRREFQHKPQNLCYSNLLAVGFKRKRENRLRNMRNMGQNFKLNVGHNYVHELVLYKKEINIVRKLRLFSSKLN